MLRDLMVILSVLDAGDRGVVCVDNHYGVALEEICLREYADVPAVPKIAATPKSDLNPLFGVTSIENDKPPVIGQTDYG